MLKVIPDNRDKARYLVDAYSPINGGAGVSIHLQTQDINVNKIIEHPNLPIDVLDQLSVYHSAEPFSVVLDDTVKERISVESYRPIGDDKTELKFTKHAKADSNRSVVIDLPVQAVDMISARGNLTNKVKGAAIDLSDEGEINLIREEYKSGDLAMFTGKQGLPLNVSEEGVDLILQRAQSKKGLFSDVMARLGLQDTFSRNAMESKPMKISSPVSLADVDAHIESRNQDNDAVAAAEL